MRHSSRVWSDSATSVSESSSISSIKASVAKKTRMILMSSHPVTSNKTVNRMAVVLAMAKEVKITSLIKLNTKSNLKVSKITKASRKSKMRRKMRIKMTTRTLKRKIMTSR